MPRGCDENAASSNRIIHSGNFLGSLSKTFPGRSDQLKFAVVGGGQSAAEMFHHLYSSYPNAQVTLVTSGIGLKPADSSEFVNTLFDQGFVDDYFCAAQGFREAFLKEHRNTNYAVVDQELISQLSRDMYSDARLGRKRLGHRGFSTVSRMHCVEDKVHLELVDGLAGKKTEEAYDGVFLGTGYSFDSGLKLLEGLTDFLVQDTENTPTINRDYSLTLRNANAKVFLLGPTERTHGLSSTLLSLLPQRAHEILRAVLPERILGTAARENGRSAVNGANRMMVEAES